MTIEAQSIWSCQPSHDGIIYRRPSYIGEVTVREGLDDDNLPCWLVLWPDRKQHKVKTAGEARRYADEQLNAGIYSQLQSEEKIAPGTRVKSLGGDGIVLFYDCDKNKYAIRWDDAPQSGKEAYWSREELTVLHDDKIEEQITKVEAEIARDLQLHVGDGAKGMARQIVRKYLSRLHRPEPETGDLVYTLHDMPEFHIALAKMNPRNDEPMARLDTVQFAAEMIRLVGRICRPGGYIKEAIKNVAHDNSVDDKYANPFPPGLLSNKVTSDSSDEEQDRDLHGPMNLTGGLVIQDVHLQEAIENVVRAHGRAEELLRDLGDARHFFESAILSRARAKTEGGKNV